MTGNYPLNLMVPAKLFHANVLASAFFPQSCLFTKWGQSDCPDDNSVAERTAKSRWLDSLRES